jgi:hypothetical protein
MLRRISSYNGPSCTPKISAIFMPGKTALRVRRNSSQASLSSTTYPYGPLASQCCSRSSRIVAWKRGPRIAGSR